MKLQTSASSLVTWGRVSALLGSLFTALAITACGGGGGSSDTVSASGSAFSQGVITGFGSVIVNGVRYDDSRASVSDDDDDDSPGRSKDDLKLGMVVTVSGSSGTGTGTAGTIAFGSELKGLVQSIATTTSGTGTATVTAGTGTLVILGQTVVVGTRTVFDPLSLPAGLANIKPGDVLEVHGHLDPTANKLTATRINKENNANHYKITGNVASLNAGSKSFKIGSETISYAAIAADKLRVVLADGFTVRVRLATVQTTTGTWSATRIKSAARKGMEGKDKTEIEGLITAFTSSTKFSVSGIPVDASTASFPRGTSTLAMGTRVEVYGKFVNGTLIATEVKIESHDEMDNEIELHGLVSDINTGSKTFALRGLTVRYDGSVTYARGNASDLKNGAAIEVKGQLASSGTTVQAQKIKFEN